MCECEDVEAGKDQLDSLGGTREAGKDHLDSLRSTREAPGKQERTKTQPSAEIARVECAKCRRECDLVLARATLCGGCARRGREMQRECVRCRLMQWL